MRALHLIRRFGAYQALLIVTSVLEDRWLRCFDRIYGVRTSGNIPLSTTSFDPSKLQNATVYSPVNAWAFRKVLKHLNLPKNLDFADLGSGLGRACIIAAEYGFQKVTGVEMASELCEVARENVLSWQSRTGSVVPVDFLTMDALEFCGQTSDDIIFMFRPFSHEFFELVLTRLAERALQLQKPLTIIYCDRALPRESYARAFSQYSALSKVYERRLFGYSFYVYRSARVPVTTGCCI